MSDFVEKLKAEFPLMYTHGDVYVGPGWQNIIFALSREIQAHIDHVNSYCDKYPDNKVERVEQVTVEQVKEKFGGLRFYYSGGDSFIDGLVSMAEVWACDTCEVCGNPGTLRDLPWMKTLCDEHFEEQKERQKQYNE
jgi:hypothetical protein